MFFYEWTKVKEKRIARKEVWAKLRNWNKIKHEKQKRDNLLWERESERERMRENEREWEREKERALGTNQKERKSGVQWCRLSRWIVFLFYIHIKTKKKKQWRKWDISASTYFATEYRINNLTCIILTGTSCDMYKTCRFRFSRIFDLPCFF